MSLILVTGASGSGKSTVREELARRCFRAFDTDEDEIAHWQHRISGKVTPLVAELHRTPEFLAQNEWKADPARMRSLANESESQTVFLCGAVGNDDEYWPLFERVFLLSIDEATLRHRLATRTTHDFGTRPHELELLLAWRAGIDGHYLRLGATLIDGTMTPSLVVDEILRKLGMAR